jgi:hypothetical protein
MREPDGRRIAVGTNEREHGETPDGNNPDRYRPRGVELPGTILGTTGQEWFGVSACAEGSWWDNPERP